MRLKHRLMLVAVLVLLCGADVEVRRTGHPIWLLYGLLGMGTACLAVGVAVGLRSVYVWRKTRAER
jgi:hypothetical protein